MNHKFRVTWSRDGIVRTNSIKGLSDLSEFIRNCDAYGRKLIRVEPEESLH